MKYYGVCVKDKSLKHVKYLKREWKNGGWKYYYEDSDNPTGIKETRAEKLAKTRQAGAESARNKVYAYNAKKAKEAEEAAKKAAKEAEKTAKQSKAKSLVNNTKNIVKKNADLRNKRLLLQKDTTNDEYSRKKKRSTISRGKSATTNILLRKDNIK